MTLAFEINDAGLVVAGQGGLLAEEPGYAMLDGREPETGQAAARRIRLAPLYAESRFWSEIGDQALPRTMPAARTFAEVAHAQLTAFAGPWLEQGPEALFAVPPWYSRAQLSMLLGVAQEAGLHPVGLVDAGLAAVSLEPVPETVMQLELGLHRTVLTLLDHAGDLRRSQFELIPRHGWLVLQQAWIQMIAETFVRKTRFDPLHDAVTEQAMCDRLPQWLEVLRTEPAVQIELEAASATRVVEVQAQQFVAAVEPVFRDLVRVLQEARPKGAPLHLQLSHRLAGLPGLDEQLADIRDCDVKVLPRGAAALGALVWEDAIRRSDGSVVLVHRLPAPLRAGASRVSAIAVSSPVVPPEMRPTHLVYRSRAHVLNRRPIQVGTASSAGTRTLIVEPGPGISRLHCAVMCDDSGVWLDDRSTYGTFVNDERISGRVQLRAGDRIRLGTPGSRCELVRAVDDDGAAPD
jgi:hypothetical protein